MPRMADTIEDDLEEIDGLSPRQRREKWAREGDFHNLWQILVTAEWGLIDQAECFQLLLQTVEVAVRTDPRRFSADIFAKMMSFTSYLLLRTHFQLGAVLERHDVGMRTLGATY